MSDERFRLEIENHSETQLLQTLQLEHRGAIQVVQLFERYYLLERYQGVRRPPVEIINPALVEKLKDKQKLQAIEAESELPPLQGIDVLIGDNNSNSRLRTAMARFAEQNPDTVERLQSLTLSPEASYAAQQAASTPIKTEGPLSDPPVTETRWPTDQQALTATTEKTASTTTKLEDLTQPVVYEALSRAKENQSRLLEQATQMRAELVAQTQQVSTALDVLPQLQSKIDSLKLRLEDWQSEMEHYHFGRDSLLERTAEELVQLQKQLRQLLSGGLALQTVMRENRYHEREDMDERLACLEDMIEHVVQQRHWVYYLQQQQAFRRLEQERVSHLHTRQQELETRIKELQSAIAEIESLNSQIVEANPLAVPEPVPVVALHELGRLEHELEILHADPALNLRLEDKT